MQQRGFAAAERSHQGNEFSFADLKVDVV